MCGVAKGMEKVGWDNVPILAVETFGAHSFYSAVQAGTLLRSLLPTTTSTTTTTQQVSLSLYLASLV